MGAGRAPGERVMGLPGGEDFRFLFLGDGARKAALKQQAQEMGLDNVVFVDSVPKEEVVKFWSVLDVSIIHLRRTGLFTTVIPSKLFECMGMGLPVLHGVAGESADMVEREGLGRVFEPENVDPLVQRLLALRDDPALRESLKQRCLQAPVRYDRKHLGMEMLGVLREVGEGKPRLNRRRRLTLLTPGV